MGIATESIIARQQAGSSQSGSKLPHSKAGLCPHRLAWRSALVLTSVFEACSAPPKSRQGHDRKGGSFALITSVV